MLHINELDYKGFIKVEKSISVLTPGYIVLNDGRIISIREDQSHNEVFSLCLYFLEKNPKCIKYEFLDGVKKLNSLGHMVYIGTTLRNIKNGGLEKGYLCLPNDSTQFQDEFVEELLMTNKSCFSDNEVLNIMTRNLCLESEKKKIKQGNC